MRRLFVSSLVLLIILCGFISSSVNSFTSSPSSRRRQQQLSSPQQQKQFCIERIRSSSLLQRSTRYITLLRQARKETAVETTTATNTNTNKEKTTTTTNNEMAAPAAVSNGQQQDSDENNDNDNNFHNLRIPQIHLPPRLVPSGIVDFHDNTVHKLHQVIGNENYIQQLETGDNKEQFSVTIPDQQQQQEQNEEGEDQKFKISIPSIPPIPFLQPQLVSSTNEWKKLKEHSNYIKSNTHIRDLLQDTERCNEMYAEHDGVYLDYARQSATKETMDLLLDLADKQNLKQRVKAMFNGDKINFTEKRAVLHTALRADKSQIGSIQDVDGIDPIKEVHEVLDQIKFFTNSIRAGTIRGYTGKRLRNIVSVGIGGSYLGPEFLHEVLKTEPEGINAALGYSLRFLANVDPVDVERTCADLDPEETLIVIVSKTFTTAETMLNARTMRQWLWDFMGNDKDVVRKHVVACASISAIDNVKKFGIDTDNYFFRFWDWVGGRYSVCSAAGAVPISLLYGYDLFEKFLKGANSIDKHFLNAPFDKNIPVIMGLLGVWNMSFMGYSTRATLPYAQALLKLPAHIQQLDMESNGKYMTRHGLEVDYPVGEIDFGEPGTNGQHSFYQLLHMGQTVPSDFIGFVQSQHDLCLDDEPLSAHDELMANFFAQPDALANGKTMDEVRADEGDNVSEDLVKHRAFKGNRPSMSLLLPKLTAYATGQLLAIYEHRTAVQGFIWDINSFDQYGVELGKKLAINVRDKLLEARNSHDECHEVEAESPATTRILNYYIDGSRNENGDDDDDDLCSTNEITSITRKTHHEHHAPPPEIHDLGGHTGKLAH